jgi:hypothetical protein
MMSGTDDGDVYVNQDDRPRRRGRPIRVRPRWRRRPVRVRPDHHAADAQYWARVAARHAGRAERKARNAQWQATIAVGLLAASLVAFVALRVLH